MYIWAFGGVGINYYFVIYYSLIALLENKNIPSAKYSCTILSQTSKTRLKLDFLFGVEGDSIEQCIFISIH
jgi:hypothetical protein